MKPDMEALLRKARAVFAALLCSLCGLSIMMGTRTAHAATLKVPAQFPTIQAAINAAAAGDTILVVQGTYTGAGNKDIDFKGKGLTVKSAGGAAKCILDCQKQGRAFYLHSDEKPASRIEGFTITNGSVSSHGGGIYVAPTVDCTALNCVFTKNSGFESGGGMYYGKAIGCVFDHNSALLNASVGSVVGHGGGCYHTSALNCTFTANSAYNGGGGVANGVAMNCTFTHNISVKNGGGVFDTTAVNCTFTDNRASSGGGIAEGAAINCVFTGNQAESSGGGAYNTTLLLHCTLTRNIATRAYAGGICVDYGDSRAIVNCIIWGNTSGGGGPDVRNDGAMLTVAYSDIGGGYEGKGNINADPLFVDPAKGDLHLKAGSPCINAGTATKAPTTDKEGNARSIGSAPDIGAFEAKQ